MRAYSKLAWANKRFARNAMVPCMPPAGEAVMPWFDSHVVKTTDLCNYLEDWVMKHEGRFPRNLSSSFRANESMRSYGALRYLADHMQGNSKNSNYRQIERIRKCETKYTALRIADNILTAMEWTHLLASEIKIYEASVVDRRVLKYRKPAIA
jgi:hypothetical protein